ncbi:MAG: dTDP-4-dehydrorhamnose 3,5-epimerase family protein [Candidatus Hodarchaeales archaeon]
MDSINRNNKGVVLDPEIGAKINPQDYSSPPSIQDIKLVELKRFVDDGGELMELGRLTSTGSFELFPEFVLRQLNFSILHPGAVKAWHLHLQQDELWFIPPSSRLLIGLFDCRRDSSTLKVSMRFVVGDGRAHLLFLPRGVAHGVANINLTPHTLLYLVDQHFSTEDTDGLRLPWDYMGSDFWKMERG